MNHTFTGFSPHSLAFFERLAANNNKSWFEQHRDEYEEYLLQPLKNLVIDLSGTMLVLDPELTTIPAVDKTISRIYRDTRFSRKGEFWGQYIELTCFERYARENRDRKRMQNRKV